MELRNIRTALVAIVIGLATLGQAHAISIDGLKEKAGGMISNGAGGQGASLLSSLSSGSFDFGSMKNAAGVLSYCQENGYLGSAGDIARNQLMDKLGMQDESSEDSGFLQGAKGILQGGDGQSFDLGRLKDRAGEKVCGLLADQATSSFLGG
nr:DUF2501 domain-containing protein [uncultured Halomonas sp.]